MEHHFADFLDRNGDYWSIVPNRERYSYSIGNVPEGSEEITVVTVGKDEKYWIRIFTFPNLEELTLHEPNRKQLEGISRIEKIRRLRITHARPKTIDFLSSLVNIEELVFEYVSGFSDLSPLQSLRKLKSLHLENLRKVNDFSGISGIESLRYLRIDGTLDWKQPISDFEFLRGLPNLEVLSLGQIINNSEYPALLPVLSLKKLKRIKIPSNMLAAKEYALLSVGLEGVKGAEREPYTLFPYSSILLPSEDIRYHLSDEIIKANHPEVRISYKGERMINDPNNEWYEFTGKNAGRVKSTSADCERKCKEYAEIFDSLKEGAKILLKTKC